VQPAGFSRSGSPRPPVHIAGTPADLRRDFGAKRLCEEIMTPTRHFVAKFFSPAEVVSQILIPLDISVQCACR
jgi:hypothetical protein